jgi:hypothetical protein
MASIPLARSQRVKTRGFLPRRQSLTTSIEGTYYNRRCILSIPENAYQGKVL